MPAVKVTRSVQDVANAIRTGRVVAYPTETVYGVGALALQASPVKKVIALKRMTSKPISVAVSRFDMIDAIADVEDRAVLQALLPGPVTVLLRKKDIVPDILTAGSSLVGIRFPSHTVACALIEYVGAPITSTSANVSGTPPATSAEEVTIDVDCVLQGGKATLGPSTVVDLVNCVILRRGAGADTVCERTGIR
ncbi:MAG TPA: L-threonylcarbamoyladenylate synthase [Candidatus Bathyarchaeia archaeon]|nr:L-threonylcarbamoyladenylate synthase [Candidatus Bathyarchaeia archaeon]